MCGPQRKAKALLQKLVNEVIQGSVHIDEDVTVRLDVLEAAPGTQRNARESVIGDRDRQTGRMPEHVI
jgi:hypothetical protein